jgi:hypothetical protein
MDAATVPTPEPNELEPAAATEPEVSTEGTVGYDIADWHGMEIVDNSGERIGKLEEIYVDVETDEPQFGTVKEGFFGRHLTFVPLIGITVGPEVLQVPVSKKQVSAAPTIALRGDELDQADESALYHHYEMNYTPPATPSGRRLARRS